MNPSRRQRLSDLRGAVRLATDATTGLTDLVEAVHGRVLRPPGLATPRPQDRAGGLTGAVYRSVRALQRGVGRTLESLIGAAEGLQSRPATAGHGEPSDRAAPASPRRDAVVAALNGLVGDRLDADHNPLAQPFVLTRGTQLGPEVLVLVHGLCMNDAQWQRAGHHHGQALERDLGLCAVLARYNTGLPIHRNGERLAQALEASLMASGTPPARLVIVGFSMGGLVARSAVHQAVRAGMAWPSRLSDLVFLGTPHHGAALERIGSVVDELLGLAPYAAPLARLGRLRSAGITDLRDGRLFDPAQALRWPPGLRLHALAGSASRKPGGIAGRLSGDGLVSVASALGHHADASRALPISPARQWVGLRLHHLDLLSDARVYARLRQALAEGDGTGTCTETETETDPGTGTGPCNHRPTPTASLKPAASA